MSWPSPGLPTGVQLVGKVVRLQDAGAAAFRHAVELHQAARPAPQDVGLQSAWNGALVQNFMWKDERS
jgi:hypothetical protein